MFINYDKSTTLLMDINNDESYAYVGAEST